MYHHVKQLMYTVRVDAPDPRFGNVLLEQFGGANGELAAAMARDRTTSSSSQPEVIEALLQDQLRDLLNAEQQLV